MKPEYVIAIATADAEWKAHTDANPDFVPDGVWLEPWAARAAPELYAVMHYLPFNEASRVYAVQWRNMGKPRVAQIAEELMAEYDRIRAELTAMADTRVAAAAAA